MVWVNPHWRKPHAFMQFNLFENHTQVKIMLSGICLRCMDLVCEYAAGHSLTRLFVFAQRAILGMASGTKSSASSINKAPLSARRLHMDAPFTLYYTPGGGEAPQPKLIIFVIGAFWAINKPHLSALPIVMKITTPYHYNYCVCARCVHNTDFKVTTYTEPKVWHPFQANRL